MRTTPTLFAIVLAAVVSTAAAQPSSQEPKSLYAISAAGLASAMSYCIGRHGELREGAPASACYAGARAVLSRSDVRRRAQQADIRCVDPATFNQCITPEVGRFVYELTAQFHTGGL